MAVNETRSMNDNLAAGLTDGVVKKIAPNRGGVDADVYAAEIRNEQLQRQYGALSYPNSHQDREVSERQTKLSEKREDGMSLAYPEDYTPPPPLIP